MRSNGNAARVFVLALLLGASQSANALLESCSVSATSLAFGTYDPLSASVRDSTGVVSVTCTVTLLGLLEAWDVRFSTGSSGTYATRLMVSGAQTLSYNIYTNAARSTIWGDGTAGTSFIADLVLLAVGGQTINYTFYGRMPVGQDKAAGNYSDTIVVTLNY